MAKSDTPETTARAAGILRQLSFIVDEGDFKKGLQTYARNFAYKPSSIEDFFRSLQNKNRINLDQWKRDWIRQTSVNTIRAEFSCDDSQKISRFELIQENTVDPTVLREHRTKIAFYNKNSQLTGIYETRYSGERTSLTELINKPCPTWINLNHEDLDFVRISLDVRTKDFWNALIQGNTPPQKIVKHLTFEQLQKSYKDMQIIESRVLQGNDPSP